MQHAQAQKSSASVIAEEASLLQPLGVPSQPYALLIDNDRDILLIVMTLLEIEGYAAFGLTNSQEVLPFLMQLPPEQLPAVLLMDVKMPGISGCDIAQQLSQDEQFASIPIVIMTGEESIHSIRSIPGASAIVRKPFHLSTILAKLSPYLSHA